MNTDTEILPRPKVEELGNSRIRITKITPSFTTGGYEPGEIRPTRSADSDQYYVIVGPSNVPRAYEITDQDERRNFGYSIELQLIDRRQPDDD